MSPLPLLAPLTLLILSSPCSLLLPSSESVKVIQVVPRRSRASLMHILNDVPASSVQNAGEEDEEVEYRVSRVDFSQMSQSTSNGTGNSQEWITDASTLS